jgi:hypothetical protein
LELIHADKSGWKGLRPRGDRSVECGFDFCLQQTIDARVGFLAERHRQRVAKNCQYCQDCQKWKLKSAFPNRCSQCESVVAFQIVNFGNLGDFGNCFRRRERMWSKPI